MYTFLGIARTVNELLDILSKLNGSAEIETHSRDYWSGVEIWYNEATNTVFLK